MLRAVCTETTDDLRFRQLYDSAFEDFEKVPLENIRRTFGRGGTLRLFFDNEQFVGICYTFENDGNVFLVYIATLPELRGNGYGSEILKLLGRVNAGKRMFLVVEKVDGTPDEISLKRRRKEFYRRNGWTDTGVQLLSDGYYFDSMYFGSPITEDVMKSTVRCYEDVHNNRI